MKVRKAIIPAAGPGKRVLSAAKAMPKEMLKNVPASREMGGKDVTGKRYLVVLRAGDDSLHHEWSQPAEYREFDLCISYYGDQPGRYEGECDCCVEGKGAKFPNLYNVLEAWGDRISQYDAVWFPDDDICTDVSAVNRMFRLFSEYKLMLAQPAVTKNARSQVTVQHIDYKVRYTYYVEPSMPIFSKEALALCRHTFNLNLTGPGMEFIWPKLLGYPRKKIAVIDDTPVKRMTSAISRNGLADSIIQDDAELGEQRDMGILQQYGVTLPEPGLITFYDGIKQWDPDPYRKSAKKATGAKKIPGKQRLVKPEVRRRIKARPRSKARAHTRLRRRAKKTGRHK